MTDFNLRQLVRDTIRSKTAKSVEWPDIAAVVLESMSPEDYRSALEQTMVPFVRDVGSSMFRHGRARPPMHTRSLTALGAKRERWSMIGEVRDNWRDDYLRPLATETGRKPYGEFNRADLTFQMDLLAGQSKDMLNMRRGHSDMRDHLDAAGVETINDLPAEILLRAAAA